MKAFHGDIAIKNKYLNRVLAHAEADEIAKGVYYEEKDGKIRACGIGCTIHSADHKAYETELGIPMWLARLEDLIFEGMPDEQAKLWPEQFLSAIQIGADLEKVKAPFMIHLMNQVLKTFDNNEYPKITANINTVINLYTLGVKEQMISDAYTYTSANASAASAASASAANSAYSASAAASDDVVVATATAIASAASAANSAYSASAAASDDVVVATATAIASAASASAANSAYSATTTAATAADVVVAAYYATTAATAADVVVAAYYATTAATAADVVVAAAYAASVARKKTFLEMSVKLLTIISSIKE